MPSTPSNSAHEAHLRATPGDGKAGVMPRAGAETRAARAMGVAAAPETAGFALSPVRVVPSGLWRAKAIAAALRAADIAVLKQARDITASMLGFRDWRELEWAATKGRADPPDEQCSAEEVRRRRAYQAYALASSSSMGPGAAAIAVHALQPTAKAGRPALDAGTLARMWEAPRERAKARIAGGLGGRGHDDWDDRGEPEADRTGHEDADAVAQVLAEAGLGSLADPLDVIDVLQRTPSIPVSVWSPVLEKRFGWAITPMDEDLERNGE